MKLAAIHVQNYRGLKDAAIPLSEFACLIGRNNSGKSSFLQCISLLSSGTKLRESDFYDPLSPIRIELTLEGIEESDLERVVAEEHRRRFANLLDGGQLRIVRTYEPETMKTSLLVVQMVPRDSRLSVSGLQALMRGKSGAELRTAVVDQIAALDSVLPPRPTQAAVVEALETIIAALPSDELVESDEPLPTGQDRSIAPLLPEVVYIPAVKDVTDEIKTTESATFGKLLHILFDQIEDQFEDLENQFSDLQRKLSRVVVDGVVTDNRLAQVRIIEETIQRFVQHNFPDVELKLIVPAPELRSILSTAEINIDDGYEGPITSKGDGLKRAVAFAVLQAYAELKGQPSTSGSGEVKKRHPYVLLFEEPELYLHPAAQAQLFSALATFSNDQTVIVTTHNPMFFDASSTKTFVKLSKQPDDAGLAPFSKTYPIDLNDMTARDQLQLVGFENNNAALFYDRVVLVEGDSDFVVYPHLLKLLIPSEVLASAGLIFVRISGKGSLKRYREFFTGCGISVFSISDLDIITNQFEKLQPSAEARRLREELIRALDATTAADDDSEANGPSGGSLRDLRRGGESLALWKASREKYSAWAGDPSSDNWNALDDAMTAMMARVEAPVRYERLKSADADSAIGKLRTQLIDELRASGSCVLSAGCLEDYFPDHLSSGEKVEGALSLCLNCTSAEEVDLSTTFRSELELILSSCAGS